MNKSLLAIAVASLLSPISNLHAQEASADETMVVTANRFEQNVDSLIVPVEVISKEEIELIQAKSLTEVLKRLPGIQISSNGGYGQTQSIFVRGAESDHVLILIDGVRFGSATAGGAPISAIPIGGVERIEYLRGARASLYGSDAIAGVINIITSNTRSENVLSATTGSDSYHQGQAFFSGLLTDKLHASLSLSALNNDGFSAQPTAGNEDADAYRSRDLAMTLRYQATEKSSLSINALIHDGDVEYDPADSSNEEKFHNVSAAYDYTNDQLKSKLTLSSNRENTFYPSFNGTYQTDRVAAAWDNLFSINENLKLGGGVDWYRDDVSETSTAYDETKRSNTALYLSGYYSSEQFAVESSVRADDNERYGSYTTWQLGAAYSLNETYRLSSNVGTGFKAPTFNDLYYPGAGDPNLEPEESTNYEVAVDASYEYLDLRVAAYKNDIKNLISGWPPQNIGKAEIEGVEIVGSFDTGPLSHQVILDFMDPVDKSDNSQLIRRAKQNYKWNMSYSYQQLDAELSYLYQGKRYDSGDVVLDSYSLFDVALTYNVTEAVKLRGKIANLFDEEYQLANGYNTQERSYFGTVEYRF